MSFVNMDDEGVYEVMGVLWPVSRHYTSGISRMGDHFACMIWVIVASLVSDFEAVRD